MKVELNVTKILETAEVLKYASPEQIKAVADAMDISDEERIEELEAMNENVFGIFAQEIGADRVKTTEKVKDGFIRVREDYEGNTHNVLFFKDDKNNWRRTDGMEIYNLLKVIAG